MRILLNFLNFHINSYAVISHISLVILFSIILYYFIISTDLNIKNKKGDENLSEIEKSEYKYKIQILSLIVFIFTSFVDYLV